MKPCPGVPARLTWPPFVATAPRHRTSRSGFLEGAAFRGHPMRLAAERTLQRHRHLGDRGEAALIRMDAAGEFPPGGWAGEHQKGHIRTPGTHSPPDPPVGIAATTAITSRVFPTQPLAHRPGGPPCAVAPDRFRRSTQEREFATPGWP